MNMTIYLPVAVMIIGGATYLLADQAKYPKLVEMGRLAFFAGLFVTLLQYSK